MRRNSNGQEEGRAETKMETAMFFPLQFLRRSNSFSGSAFSVISVVNLVVCFFLLAQLPSHRWRTNLDITQALNLLLFGLFKNSKLQEERFKAAAWSE
jgi:hypothetical protein